LITLQGSARMTAALTWIIGVMPVPPANMTMCCRKSKAEQGTQVNFGALQQARQSHTSETDCSTCRVP
jgi:hypothetical protein